jgi:hypothetical protein
VAWIAGAVGGGAAACGTDIDLGAVDDAGFDSPSALPDASAPATSDDAEPPLEPCDPCLAASECGRNGTCIVLDGGNSYCVALCPGAGCAATDACRAVTSVANDRADACVPTSGTCAAPPGPTADGAVIQRCGDLVGPPIAAACRSCNPSSSTCQPNGCYGGWWCNTYYRRCQRPPTGC